MHLIYKKMTSTFETVLVKDERLLCHSTVDYAVVKGPQQNTAQIYTANSATPSNVNFNVQIPSLTTVIDRNVLFEAVVEFQINYTPVQIGGAGNWFGIQYGSMASFAPYPLHQLMTNLSVTINNNTVSVPMVDILPLFLKFIDDETANAYNITTPTMQDKYKNYVQGINAINNSLGSYANSVGRDGAPARGSFKLLSCSNASGAVDGVFNVPQAWVANPGPQTSYIRVRFVEPLMCSPFIFGHVKSNNQGFYGVSTISVQMNMDAQAKRAWRNAVTVGTASASQALVTGVTVSSIKDAHLNFDFLNPMPSDILPSQNTVGFYEWSRFITQVDGSIPVSTGAPTSQTFTSQTFTLNTIPDKIVIAVRSKRRLDTTLATAGYAKCYAEADWFAPIKAITIQFNNVAGLLSTFTREQLYAISVKNGIKATYDEWCGVANSIAPIEFVPSTTNIGANQIPTTGSVFCCSCANDLSLASDYLSAGVMGQYVLQVKVQCENYDQVNAMEELELVVMCMNSGLFVNNLGSSSTYIGILSKNDVLEASTKEPYSRTDVQRMVGGGFLDGLSSVFRAVKPIGSIAKTVTGMIPHPGAQATSQVLSALGMGQSGGGSSGGGVSGGRIPLANRIK
jgi:hypothetical protein